MAGIWFGVLVFALLMYVVLDGYDLGIGIASMFERDKASRDKMLEQVAQAWDGNESWLVLAALVLWAGYPTAFGAILPHAYLAVILMLFALGVRGVSVELASQTHDRALFEWTFGIGSLVAALAQGALLSSLASRVTLVDNAFSGSAFGAFGWFTFLVCALLVALYLSYGYAYMKWKSTGELRTRVARRGEITTAVTAMLAVAFFLALDNTDAPLNLDSAGRTVAFVVLLAAAGTGIAVAMWSLRPASTNDGRSFVGLAIATVAIAVAIVVGRYPTIVPGVPSVEDALSPDTTMWFLFVGIGINLPLIVFYTWFGHHAFRDKAYGTGARLPRSGR
ncbi:MAG TPA: cytochrome d ubiquinol oxidase subunit II [Acidimicrobiia bacterium]|jgi:cytochrome d ubiquinol oxidase subunit II